MGLEKIEEKNEMRKQPIAEENGQKNTATEGFLELLVALRNFDKDFTKKTMARVLENIVMGDSSSRKLKRQQPSRLPKMLHNTRRTQGPANPNRAKLDKIIRFRMIAGTLMIT